MKKIFSGVSIMFILLTIVLAGCSDAYDLKGNLTGSTDVTKTETVPSLKAPGNVKAVNEYDGLIRLTWDPVADADGYEIHRRDSNGVSKRLNTAKIDAAQNYYDDLAGFDNQLVAGKSYEYRIIALSGQSTYARLALANDVIWNGEATVSITPAKMPAMYENMPAVTGLTTKKVVRNNVDYLVVTWDAIPTASYTVNYNIGTIVTGVQAQAGTMNVANADIYQAAKGSATFPLFGGINTVKLTSAYKNAPYYEAVDASIVTAELAITALTTPANFTAARTTNNVVLTWDGVDDAESYAVYRALIDDGDTIIGDWAAVNVVYVEENDDVNGKWQTVDANVSKDNAYLYALVAQAGGGRKSAPAYNTVNSSVNIVPFETPDFTVDIRYKGNNTAAPAAEIDIVWDTEEGIDYKLYRAPITFDEGIAIDNTTVPHTVGTYTEIDNIDFGVYPTIAAAVDAPEYRTSYRYKLVAIRGAEEAAPKYRNMVEAPFIDRTEITLTAKPHDEIPYAVLLEFEDDSGYSADLIAKTTTSKESLKIYRRISTDPETGFVDITNFNSVTVNVPSANTLTYAYIDQFSIVDKLTIAEYGDTKRYEYMVIVSDKENLFTDDNDDLIADTLLSTHATVGTLSLNNVPTLNGTNLSGIVLQLNSGTRLISSEWDIQYRYGTGTPPAYSWSAWIDHTTSIGVSSSTDSATDRATLPFSLPDYTSGEYVELRIRPKGYSGNDKWVTINAVMGPY